MSPVVDACVLVGRSRYGGDGGDGGELTLDDLPALGADTVVAAPAAPADRDLAAATDRLLVAADGLPVRLAVLARVDPWEPDALPAARRALDAGAVGLFLHPWEETFKVTDAGLLDPYLRLLASAGRPVVVDAGYPWLAEPAQLGELAARHPDVTVVGTRGGHMNMSGISGQTALAALRRAPNLHVLTSGVYRQDWLTEVVDELGAHRLAYGSLAPTLDPRLELLRPRALPDDAVRDQVLHGTATALFGL